ncbi:uncharacterized protein LOC126832272 [Patella vulgata]|uniref:uncharacterized protein LOC126832272 n=1 Tax=Patella vulgata TaxID=6465 RepID=UPI00218010A4|nr:uncharacterized protein LOC126832272 [Patella vulgata]
MKTDMGGRRKGFKARVTLVRPEDMCYTVSDRGQTYRGKVNYDRDFRSCIPWRKTTNCPHHQYQSEQTGAPLEDNYCRNPDHTFTPWCYILNSEGECERNYCDACGLEDAYDKVRNCKKLKEEGFCSKPKEEVLPKCAKTCSAAASKEKSITMVKCPAPEKLADSDLVGELKSSYSVGDTVKYQCKTGNETHIISCLSDGSWSPGKYVCGACSTGWLASGGVCLKYFSQPLTFVMATQFCQQYGGSVADAKTKEQMEFLVSIRTKTFTMWIGLNDIKEEGKFVWSDETPLVWNNWSKGSPNNNYNMEDCVIMYGEQLDNTWNDHPCRSKFYQYSFTCQNKPSKRILCVNRREDCKKLLQADPKMCVSRRDFSSENCAADCGICKTSQEVKSCDVVAATPNVILETQEKQIPTGHVVRYKCQSGFVQDGGDKVRSCMVDKSLSGKPLVCKSSENVIEPSNNVQLHRFTRIGNQCQMYTSSNDNFRIKRSGEIMKWEFYSLYPGQAALVVFRPTNDKFQFQVIGINQLVKSSDDSLQTLAIPPNERIKVQPNDQIGIWYAYKRAGIPFVYCDGTEHPEADNTLQLKGYMCNPNHLQVDKVYSFNQRRVLCRIFSLRAQIGPAS